MENLRISTLGQLESLSLDDIPFAPHALGSRAEVTIGKDIVSIVKREKDPFKGDFEVYFLKDSPNRTKLMTLMPKASDPQIGQREDMKLTQDEVIPFLKKVAEISLIGNNRTPSRTLA